MNRLSILLVIAFVSYTLSSESPVPTSDANTEKADDYEAGEYVESYEIVYGNFTKQGNVDIAFKFHTAPQGVIKLEALSFDDLLCAGKCVLSCLKGKKTLSCIFCMAKCGNK